MTLHNRPSEMKERRPWEQITVCQHVLPSSIMQRQNSGTVSSKSKFVCLISWVPSRTHLDGRSGQTGCASGLPRCVETGDSNKSAESVARLRRRTIMPCNSGNIGRRSVPLFLLCKFLDFCLLCTYSTNRFSLTGWAAHSCLFKSPNHSFGHFKIKTN